MKKTTLLAAFILFLSLSTKAQYEDNELKPFKVDISLGYAIPGGSGAKGGALFVVEPKYAAIPNISVGLRMEVAVVARVQGIDAYGNAESADVKAAGSYLLTGDYYFTNRYSFRPFAGAGLGIFSLASASENSNGSTTSGQGSKFGGMIRAGIETGHFRVGVEYNLVPSTTIKGTDVNNQPISEKSKNGYIGIKLGVCIGGGRL